MYIVLCSKCNTEVERSANISVATCFKCKKKVRTEREKQHRLLKKELSIIKKQTKRAKDPRITVLKDDVKVMEVKRDYRGNPLSTGTTQ